MPLTMECVNYRFLITPISIAKTRSKAISWLRFWHSPSKKGFLKVGEWNEQEVIVRGSKIIVPKRRDYSDTDLSKVDTFMADKAHPELLNKEGHFGFT